MFNSLNDFKVDIEKQLSRKLQNATVRGITGFHGGHNQPIEQKTLFSNSFIRDSVISTLKHNSKDGEGGGRDRVSDSGSDMHSATHTLNQPRLSLLDNNSVEHNPYIGAKRPSILSQTSYFNEVIMEKPDDADAGQSNKVRVDR